MGRSADRRGETAEVRILLLEGDADLTDKTMSTLNDRVGKMLWAMVGILISTTTAAIMLVLNLTVKR